MSRADNIGMFWQDVEVPKPGRTERGPGPLPPIPETGWRPPKEFPRLDSAKLLCIDCETFDPGLDEHGPGWGRGSGHIVGVAVGDGEGSGWYFPMRHELGAEDNMDPDKVLAWARDTFADARQPKVFTNATYDLGWLSEEGVEVAGRIHDVQIAEPLLDEYAYTYALDALAHKWLGFGKPQDKMIEWMLDAYGGSKRTVKSNIYRTPPSLVGPYAQGDVNLPPLILVQQLAQIEREGLLPVYEMETRLPRILVRMRRQGVRVDLDKAKLVDDDLTKRVDVVTKELDGLNPNAPTDLIKYANKLGVVPPKTELGNPSFAGKWLERNMPRVAELRGLLKMRDTFIRGYIFAHEVNGRLHCSFNQLRSDFLGTVSGRFSSSDPNLQNIPARDEEFGPLLRSLYVPDNGHKQWRRYDWSQIEYRFLVHFALGRGAEAAREMYRKNPKTDFHVMTQELIWPGRPEMRRASKTINFGLVYGMGIPLLASTLGRPEDEAGELIETYHTRQPYVRHTYQAASRRAAQREYVLTIKQRRARFPGGRETHKALNRILQGSAGEAMKECMVQMDDAGLYDVIEAPYLIVHDEYDWSDEGTKEADEAFVEVKRIMENVIPLSVPLLADMEIGPDWGHTEKAK